MVKTVQSNINGIQQYQTSSKDCLEQHSFTESSEASQKLMKERGKYSSLGEMWKLPKEKAPCMRPPIVSQMKGEIKKTKCLGSFMLEQMVLQIS